MLWSATLNFKSTPRGGEGYGYQKVEDYAVKHGLSFRKAKKKLKGGGEGRFTLPARGLPVAGTGKVHGPAKG